MIVLCSDQVTVFQSVIQQTNSAVITSAGSVVVTDPAWLPAEIAEIAAFAKQPVGRIPARLLFTHSDFDHILGYGAFPGSNVIAGKALADHPDKKAALAAVWEWDNKHYLTRPYPIAYPRVDMPVHADERDFPFGRTRLRFFLAPGHNRDGILTLVEEPGILIAGDYLSDFELPVINHSYRDYCTTLRKAERLIAEGRVQMVIPGHGKVTQDLAEMQRRLKVAFDYLAKLEEAVTKNDELLLRCLSEQFAFPSSFTQACQDTNVRIVRQELGIGKKQGRPLRG